MSNGNGTPSQVNVQTPIGSFSFNGKRMAEFISVMLAIVVAIMAYILWDHQQDSRQAAGDFKAFLSTMAESNKNALQEISRANREAVGELVQAQKENVQAQREMNCLISLPQEERRKEFLGENSFCKRISR